MQVAEIVDLTEVEGPGLRSALWLQGCSINCFNCCNQSFIPQKGGFFFDSIELSTRFINNKKIQGITILGGEPLDQSEELYIFLKEIKNNSNLSIMLFTGYTHKKVINNTIKNKVFELCDLVISEPFINNLISNKRRWIGSSNQKIHFVSDRYKNLEDNWQPYYKEIEFHIKDGEIIINGMPIESGIF